MAGMSANYVYGVSEFARDEDRMAAHIQILLDKLMHTVALEDRLEVLRDLQVRSPDFKKLKN